MPISNSEHIDIGIISNYMSTDSSNIFQFFTMMHYLWAVPIKIVILLYLLYQQMGISALIGLNIVYHGFLLIVFLQELPYSLFFHHFSIIAHEKYHKFKSFKWIFPINDFLKRLNCLWE